MGSAATEVCNLTLWLSQTMQCLITLFFNMKVNYFLKRGRFMLITFPLTEQ